MGELNDDFFKSMVRHMVDKEGLEEHLCEKIFPILLPGLEELSKEIERYKLQVDEIDPRIRERFNPCLWLAQFLMRNNPRYGQNQYILKDYEQKAYLEAFRRVLNNSLL